MSYQIIKLKIDVKAILKDALFHATSGKVYLDATVFLKDEEDQYGNCGMITQDLKKERRDAGEKGPILGNVKRMGPPKTQNQAPPQQNRQQARPDAFPPGLDDDEIPF